MATLHRIVLATAGSWNNGTSSPAPQGNRAWSNETTALAERQEPTSAETPPILNPIGKGIGKFWIPSIALILLAFVVPNDAQAQRQAIPKPDYEIYGTDRYSYQEEIDGSWFTRVAERNTIYAPSNTRDEYASRIETAPEEDVPYVLKSVRATKWFRDGSFKNRFNYDVFFRWNSDGSNKRESYGEANPARYTSGKKWRVGTRVKYKYYLFDRDVKETWTYKSYVDFTATHTTGGKVTFLVTITYAVEGSDTDTTIQFPIKLSPGETTTIRLSVPGGGKWADIVGIDIMANRQPNPIQVSPQNRRASPNDVLDSLIPPDVYFGPGAPLVPRPPNKKPTPPPVNQN